MNQYLVVGLVFLVVVALLATNKKVVETLKNIYKIEELRKRVIYTIGLLLIYRLGSFVVIPGITLTSWARVRRMPASWRATDFWVC